MSYEHEAYNGNVQYADCKLVSIQHGSARLHRRDAEVPILPCWPDRLRTHLPLQKTCSLLRRATQAARFRGSRVHRIFFCPGYKLRLLVHTRSVRSCMYIPLPATTGSHVLAQRTPTTVVYSDYCFFFFLTTQLFRSVYIQRLWVSVGLVRKNQLSRVAVCTCTNGRCMREIGRAHV